MNVEGVLNILAKTHRRFTIWAVTQGALIGAFMAAKSGNYDSFAMWSVALGTAFGAAHTVEAIKKPVVPGPKP